MRAFTLRSFLPLMAFTVSISTGILSPLSLAQAQSGDVRPLYDRIDRLERDIQTLQSQLARGGSGGLVVTSPSAGGAGAAGGGIGAGAADRLDQLEDRLRELTGKIEEANHKAMLNQRALERMQADIDIRFKELQTPPTGTGAAPTADAAPAVPDAKGADAKAADAKKPGGPTPPNNSADGPGLAPGPQVLGQISAKDVKKGVDAAPEAPAKAAVIPKDPKAAYDAAYAKFQARDYDGATEAFKGFIGKFPEHQLVPSAIFWEGEAAYVQNDFKTAAAYFGDGYRRYSSSSKAPDLVYKLGKSFAQLNMTKEACRAFKILQDNHPDMPDRLKKAAAADKAKLGC